MKLKDTFVIQRFDDEQILVDTGEDAFHGMVRCNATAAFIVNCLQEETTQKAVVCAMQAKYDAPQEVLMKNVDEMLTKLRSINALEE